MMQPKILVCDDEQEILSVTSLILEDSGYLVIPVLDSLQVMAKIASEAPDLVLLDLWMPGMRGDEIVRNIRQQDEMSGLPVLVFSASREGKDIALNAGANGFMAKPFDLENLLDTIERLVGC